MTQWNPQLSSASLLQTMSVCMCTCDRQWICVKAFIVGLNRRQRHTHALFCTQRDSDTLLPEECPIRLKDRDLKAGGEIFMRWGENVQSVGVLQELCLQQNCSVIACVIQQGDSRSGQWGITRCDVALIWLHSNILIPSRLTTVGFHSDISCFVFPRYLYFGAKDFSLIFTQKHTLIFKKLLIGLWFEWIRIQIISLYLDYNTACKRNTKTILFS